MSDAPAMTNGDFSREELLGELTHLRAQLAALRAQEHARKSSIDAREFFAILSALPDVIFVLDASGLYRKICTGESGLLADSPDALLGKTIHEVLAPEAAQGIQAVIDVTLSTRSRQQMDYPLQVESGTLWFNGTVVPLELDGETCVLWVARDITAQKLAEEQAREANAAIERDLLKSKFLAHLSHELRTPIYGIVGYIELLERSALQREQIEFVSHVKNCASSLQVLINELLDFSRYDAGQVSARHEPFDFCATITHVTDIFRPQLLELGIELHCDVDDAIPGALRGDANRIQQILGNLVGNAIKFSHRGSVRVRAALDGESDNESLLMVRIDVADTGIGISKEDLTTIFEPFVQADGSMTREHEGAGLGLAIARQLVELLGGRIEVSSTLGQGAMFSVHLPLERAAEVTAASDDDGHDATLTSRTHHVLLAEDNAIVQKLTRRLLETIGCTVDVVSNGQEAFTAISERHYDVVFMDCQMPVMDGYSATKKIRAVEDQRRRTPIIALTAHAMEGDRQDCLDVGMDDYLAKPLAISDLRAALHRLSP